MFRHLILGIPRVEQKSASYAKVHIHRPYPPFSIRHLVAGISVFNQPHHIVFHRLVVAIFRSLVHKWRNPPFSICRLNSNNPPIS